MHPGPTCMVRSPDGTEVAAYDFGGEGPALLLAHATGLHAWTLEPLIRRLLASFRCYAFDERGHGASAIPPNGDFDWRRFGDDARAVAEAFGLERPAAFGHSCGGALLVLAEEEHPGSWDRLYLFEPVILPPSFWEQGVTDSRPPDGEDHPLAAGALRRRRQFSNRAAALRNFEAKPPFDRVDPEALAAYVEHGFRDNPDGSVALACHPESEAATYMAGMDHDAWDHLGDVLCPTTVACGDRDPPFGPETTAAVAGRLARGRDEVLPGLGHFAPLEDPARLARSVIAAIGS